MYALKNHIECLYQTGEHLKPSTRGLPTSIILGVQPARPTNKQNTNNKNIYEENKQNSNNKNINTEKNRFGCNMEQQSGEKNVPKTLGNKANENQVEQRNKANENQIEQGNKANEAKEQRKKAKEANENPVDNSKQKDREGPEQNSSKGSLEGSQVQKCSVSFEETQKNGSLEACRERSGSGGSSISSNGNSSKSSNGSSKKVVVVRSAPITIGKVKVIKTPVGPFFGS